MTHIKTRSLFAFAFLALSLFTLQACGSNESVEMDEDVPMMAEENEMDDSHSDDAMETEDDTMMEDDSDDEMESEDDVMESGDVSAAWQLDSQNSTMEWEATRLASAPHVGNVELAGYLSQDRQSGEFIIDMDSISESKNSQRVVDHLKDDDFFNVDEFPTSELVITSSEDNADGTMMVKADLTILDVTNPITFNATVTEEGGQLNAQADFEIDRTLWGVNFDSNTIKEIGDRAIKDQVQFRLNLTFTKGE